jgi:hypothetical protein
MTGRRNREETVAKQLTIFVANQQAGCAVLEDEELYSL